MKYLYSKEKIDKTLKRLRRFRKLGVYLSEHFADTPNVVIEVCGLDESVDGMKREARVNQILAEELGKGAHLECYSSCCHYCYVGEDKGDKGTKYNPIVLDGKNIEDYPNTMIFFIQESWRDETLREGGKGTFVSGEKFNFSYDDKYYTLKPLEAVPQSLGREKIARWVKRALEIVGCKKVSFDWGKMG